MPIIAISEPYKKLYSSKKKIILVTGGRGSAKSFNTSLFCKRLSYQNGHKILFTRYTLTSAEISIMPEFQEKIEIEGDHKYFHSTKTEIKNKYSGSQILFRGIKTSSGVQTANLKSIQGITTFVVDEGEEWISEEDYDKIRLSIRKKGVQNRVIIVMNPTDDTHFVYDKYIKDTHKLVEYDGVKVQISTHPDVEHIHTTYHDCIDYLSPTFLNDIEEIKINNPKKYAHKIIGAWADRPEGVILENWEEGTFDDTLPYCYGQDYGYSIDPTTLVKVAVNHLKKIIHVHECFYLPKSSLSTEQIAQLNIANITNKNDLIVADKSEGRLIGELSRTGLHIRPSLGEKVSFGLTRMQDYKIVVTPESVNYKRELRKYKWSDKKSGIPIDAENHLIDPTRYALEALLKVKLVFA